MGRLRGEQSWACIWLLFALSLALVCVGVGADQHYARTYEKTFGKPPPPNLFDYIVEGILEDIGEAVEKTQPPFDTRQGRKFHYLGHEMSIESAMKCLNGTWVHLAGDSTMRQLYNSLLYMLDRNKEFKAFSKYDECLTNHPSRENLLGHMRGGNILPYNTTDEKILWFKKIVLDMCECRNHLVWAEQIWTTQKQGFDFRLTFSWKELMYEPADMGLFNGNFERRNWTGHTTGNLYEAIANGTLPDVLMAGNAAHAFHVPEMGDPMAGPTMPMVKALAENITRYAAFIQKTYLKGERTETWRWMQPGKGQPDGIEKSSRCAIWKSANVVLPGCPATYYRELNYATMPAMMAAGFHVMNTEPLVNMIPKEIKENFRRKCDMHATPAHAVTLLALRAICQGCLNKFP